MKDKEKTKQLINEILDLRRKIAVLQSNKPKNKAENEFGSELSAGDIKNKTVLNAIVSACLAASENADFQAVSVKIVKKFMELTGAANAYIAFSINEGKEDIILFIDSEDKICSLDPNLPLPIQGLRKEVYRTGNAIYHNNFSGFEWVELSSYRHITVENVLMSPILINSAVKGLFSLMNKTGGFTDDDLSIAQLFAANIAVALQRGYDRAMLQDFIDLKAQFRSITAASMDAIICSDNNGKIIFWNKAAENIFGYPENEIIGKTVLLLMPERLKLLNQDLFKRFVLSGKHNLPEKIQEVTGLRKDGVEFPAELYLASWEIGKERFFTGIIRDITEKKKDEFNLINMEHRYMELIDGIDAILWEANPETRQYIFVSAMAEKISGFPLSRWLNEPDFLLNHMHPDDRYKAAFFYRAAIDKAKNHEFEFRMIRADGTTIWLRDLVTVTYKDAKLVNFKGLLIDITGHKRSLQETKTITAAIEQSDDWILISDIMGNIEYVNKGVEKITGYSRQELAGQHISIFNPGWNSEKIYNDIRDTLLSGKSYNGIVSYRKKDGQLIEIFQSFTPLEDINLKITHFVTTAKEITLQGTTKERLFFLAYYDSLTGLPNQSLFLDRVNQAIARIEYKKRLIAVLIIDINGFKSINDQYGFQTGDAILKRLGNILSNLIRECDTVARLENDEFGISFIDVGHINDIINLAEMIIKKIAEPLMIGNNQITISVCIGISVYPEDGRDANEMTRKAYLALSKAKQSKTKTYKFYTQEINIKAAEVVQIEKNLFKSLAKEEFILYYQPYFEMNTKKIMGVEALVRWDSNELGMVSPGKFIPLLEETGMIIEVGKWIFKSVIRQLRQWKDKGYAIYPISVNLCQAQFKQKDLREVIIRETKSNGIDPSLLVLEIPESIFMQDIEYSKKAIKNLKDVGVSISLDDFGTSYSSLSCLKNIPIDNLKIDISLVKEIAFDPSIVSVVTTIISVAHNLNIKTIAEGVETEDQWKILKLLRCDIAQGYYLSRPLLPDSLVKLFLGYTS